MKTATKLAIQALSFALALTGASPLHAAQWSQKSAGSYNWADAANWTGGALPTAETDADFGGISSSCRPSGDQTISGGGEARTMDFHNAAWNRSRTFTGDVAASNLLLRVGTVNIDGTVELTGTGQAYSLIGAAMLNTHNPGGVLDIRSGGTLRADGVHALSVGRRAAADNTAAGGRVVLEEGGKLVLNPSGSTASLAGLQLGRNDGKRTGAYSASYVQKGGEAVVGRVMAGFEKGTFAALAILGGSLDMPYISGDTRFRIGHAGWGAFHLHGGEVSCNASLNTEIATWARRTAQRAYTFEIGSGQNASDGLKGAWFYADGGSFTTGSDFSIQGQSFSKTGVAPAHATIAGTATVKARTMRVGANGGDGRASLNLKGGTLETDLVFANPGRPGTSEINADGGKIVFPASAQQEQFFFLDAVNLYEGGLEVECNRAVYIGNAGTNVLLRTPAGYGIDIASFATIGSTLTPLPVEISGGEGSGASVVTLLDYDTGDVTNAVVACRGEGFAAGDVPVATIFSPFGEQLSFADRIALSVSENKPGALVKTGASALTLFAQPEFAGTYEVRQGAMIQTTTAGVASPKVAAVVVGGQNASFQCGSGNATAVKANWNPINPEATLTLGTANGPGTLVIPRAAAGETEPFRQAFASLAVSGAGNAITHANNGASTNGAVVSFGTISCDEDSQLTIPDPKTGAVKVYCTGMPAGTSLKNIVFDGDDVHTAMVGDDGQLVPLPLAFVMVVR